MTTSPGPPGPATVIGRPGMGVGASAPRPDGTLKVTGEFAFSSDLWMADMLWGATLRSPHPRARIRAVNIAGALRLPGVAAVLTHDDVPGRKTFGLEAADQPVLASGEIRYQGEPVVIVAADHPETARRAVAAITVDYDVLTPVTDARAALLPGADEVHPGGNLVRHVRIRRGDPHARTDIVVTGEYEVGMQDQAFLGPESGLAVPAEDGGVELYVATQWLHVDQAQVAASLGLPPDKVRVVLAGVGGAFGAREDLSMQIHACLLALYTGRPVKMVYSREESFFGHVHRHPAKLYYTARHYAGRPAGLRRGAHLPRRRGLHVELSRCGGERGHAREWARTRYRTSAIDVYASYTNNPPCGAMRGFGAVQACFAYESQMDELARRIGMDPARVPHPQRDVARARSCRPGRWSTRRRRSPNCCAGCPPRRCRPARPPGTAPDLRELPGGVSNTTHGEGVVRGVGYGVGIKNVGLLRGVRRLLHRPGTAGGRGGRAGRDRAHRGCGGRPGPGHRARRRSPGPNLGWTGWSSIPPTPRSAAPGRRRRPGRRTSPAGRCRPPAPPSGPWCSSGRPACSACPPRACRCPAARSARRPPGYSPTWPTCSATRRSRRRSPGGTGPPSRWTRTPARATRTCSTRSPRTGRWWTWTPSLAW